MSLDDLCRCHVSTGTLKLYGERIIAAILKFIKSHKLEQCLTEKLTGNSAGMTGQPTAQGATAPPKLSVLPKSHTEALQAQLTALILSMASQVNIPNSSHVRWDTQFIAPAHSPFTKQ